MCICFPCSIYYEACHLRSSLTLFLSLSVSLFPSFSLLLCLSRALSPPFSQLLSSPSSHTAVDADAASSFLLSRPRQRKDPDLQFRDEHNNLRGTGNEHNHIRGTRSFFDDVGIRESNVPSPLVPSRVSTQLPSARARGVCV